MQCSAVYEQLHMRRIALSVYLMYKTYKTTSLMLTHFLLPLLFHLSIRNFLAQMFKYLPEMLSVLGMGPFYWLPPRYQRNKAQWWTTIMKRWWCASWWCDVQLAEQIKDDDDKDEEEKVRCATIWWAEENHGWAKARSSHLVRLFRTNQRVQHNSWLNTISTVPFFWLINLSSLHQSNIFLIL